MPELTSVASFSQRFNQFEFPPARSGDEGQSSRKPTPNPLQVSLASPSTTSDVSPRAGHELGRYENGPSQPGSRYSPHSPQSPRLNVHLDQSSPKSPRERLDELLATEHPTTRGDLTRATYNRGTAGITVKDLSHSQSRNVSSPLPPSHNQIFASPPHSPSILGPTTASNLMTRPDPRSNVRTSSFESTSSFSSLTSASHKTSLDSNASNSTDITSLISTAGSPENLIHQLLKDKQHSAAQLEKLWKLVDKQRALVLGLNQDLERALKDKERYRAMLNEHLAKLPPIPRNAQEIDKSGQNQSAAEARAPSTTPSLADSQDELIIQRHSAASSIDHTHSQAELTNASSSVVVPETVEEERHSASPQRSLSTGPKSLPTVSGNENRLAKKDSETRPPLPIEISTEDVAKDGLSTGSPSPFSSITMIRPGSFTAKRSYHAEKGPSSTATGSTPVSTPPSLDSKGMPILRKPPPAPLDLQLPMPPATHDIEKPSHTSGHVKYGPDDHSGSEYDDVLEVDEIPAFERGRRKTREEDDRLRETALLKEKASRSHSKREKHSKPATDGAIPKVPEQDIEHGPQVLPKASRVMAIAPETGPQSETKTGLSYSSSSASLASMLSSPQIHKPSISGLSSVSSPPMSPGLPLSPRPNARPVGSALPKNPKDRVSLAVASPPLSARGIAGFAGMPLSPRAPRHAIPMPPHTPLSTAPPLTPQIEHRQQASQPPQPPQHDRQHIAKEDSPKNEAFAQGPKWPTRSRGINRTFMSDMYPNLLLPPNALPHVSVLVTSSRMKPSHHSSTSPKSQSEDEPVFTLGIFARSDGQECWRVERPLMSLPQLDQQLKQCSSVTAKLPDRSLFSGHAPAKIDARRTALKRYFESILDTQMDEKAALLVCVYLSNMAIEPKHDDINSVYNNSGSPISSAPDGWLRKEGYLTKRGKNFGGWKARFFVLEDPVLKYYETPGGALLGTIKLQNAQIGKQSAQHQTSESPTRGEDDKQYRHAFLILEPKRRDSSSMVRHVLCAESDDERDGWVDALLQYVEPTSEDESKKGPAFARLGSRKISMSLVQPKKRSGSRDETDSPLSETGETLQATSYEKTVPGQPPIRVTSNGRTTDSPTRGTDAQSISAVDASRISAPLNGAVIADAGAWGNKATSHLQAKDKDPKQKVKGKSIWSFRDRSCPELEGKGPNGSNVNLLSNGRTAHYRPAFGAPLSEAVEFYSPRGVDVCLPAVVYRCLEYLDIKNAANEEGIFRMSGSNVVIKALRQRFNTEGDFDFLANDQYYDVHAVASLLKLYLRELPVTVLTRELHLDFLQVLDLDDKEKKIVAFNALVHKLPAANWSLIRALVAFLLEIVNNSDVNKMTIRNVGIVFAPTLNIPAPIFSMFLTDYDAIFGADPDESVPSPLEAAVPEPLTPEDIRSPRRQMFSEIPTPSYDQQSFPRQPATAGYEAKAQKLFRNPPSSDNNTGFIPLQPSYEPQTTSSVTFQPPRSKSISTADGAEYGSINGSLVPSNNIFKSAKNRRRESAMLYMGVDRRKSVMPDTVFE